MKKNDIDELSKKLADAVIYPKRKYSPVIMGGAFFLFFGLILAAVVITSLAGEFQNSIPYLAPGLLLPLMILIVWKGNEMRYIIRPDGVVYQPYRGRETVIGWKDVTRIGVEAASEGGSSFIIAARSGDEIVIEPGVPNIDEAVKLIQMHLNINGKQSLIEKLVNKKSGV